MAERRPLVLVGGKLMELPAGDTLPGVGGGTMTFPSATSLTTGAISADVLPGAMNQGSVTPTATVWTEILNLAAPGILHGAIARVTGSGSKTVGLRITIDGVAVVQFDSPSGTSATAWAGMVAINTNALALGWAPFQTLKVEVRCSLAQAVSYGVIYTGLSS